MADSRESATDDSNTTPVPLRPALRPEDSPKVGPTKVVSIAEPEEAHSPVLQAEDAHSKRHHVAGAIKRMIGRPPSAGSSPRLLAMNHAQAQAHLEDVSNDREKLAEYKLMFETLHEKTLNWLQAEKQKLKRSAAEENESQEASVPSTGPLTPDLDKLGKILEETKVSHNRDSIISLGSPSLGPRRPSLLGHKRQSSKASSDTEFYDGDVVVPNCDVMLDNSKTLSYSGGAADDSSSISSKRVDKERKAWASFKSEIVKLTHTLKLKGWRRIPLENGPDIDVERLSGAMTNAVYVVSPPKDLPPPPPGSGFRKTPPKLLLRIYGPQVEHLIDRESELSILRRLARKKIGPRLLGTFRNGRFEEFFNAITLTSPDLRVPETSKQIAKRMRELHDGVELLERERDAGPFVWCNWDKWVDRVEKVITFLDKQILDAVDEPKTAADAWKSRGLVCGVEWPVFKKAIDRYRQWLDEYYGGSKVIREKLVFAHNDTQYGNILRLKPSGESPLSLPANEHKQLIVIDFEYASANMPGLEFANHFSEWCYNYHDATAPHACNTQNYPTIEEQRRFIRSYVNHRPSFHPKASATPSQTPKLAASGPSSSVSSFMLDARYPSGVNTPSADEAIQEEERRREEAVAKEVEKLMKEARIWRVANSAQWVAWGIVQAKVPGLDDVPSSPSTTSSSSGNVVLQSDALSPEIAALKKRHDHDQRPEGGLLADALRSGHSLTPEQVEEIEELEEADERAEATTEAAEGNEEEEEEFDYLAYSQQRAMFFWGDVVTLGIVKKEELPKELLSKMKIVEY